MDCTNNRAPYISSSVHRVVEEEYNSAQARVVFETDLSHPDMHTAVSGHRVNGSSLCPSSLYADIALTIAKYIRDQPNSGLDQDGHDVCDMEVTQPLIISPRHGEENRKLRVVTQIDRQKSILFLEYSSYGRTPTTPVKHALCRVEFGDPRKWSRRWVHDLHMVKDRISGLKVASHSGEANSITKRLAYRLFSNLVDYAPDFQRMNQVWLDSGRLEAAAVVSLDRRDTDANFSFSPYHLDGLLHLSGFIMNGNDDIDANEAVYISHGWQSLRLAEPLVKDANYDVYVKMLPADKTMVAGNVYILHGEKVLALCEGIRFQRVPRAVLDMLLPPVPSRRPRQTARPIAERAKDNSPIVKLLEPSSVAQNQKELPLAAAQLPATSANTSTQSDLAMQVIASEIGLSTGDLKVTDNLADLGVDSLMSLALAGQLVDQCGVNVDHGELMQCISIQDLLKLLRDRQNPPTAPSEEHSSNSSSGSSSGSSVSCSAGLGTVTPSTGATTPAVKPADDIERLLYSIVLEETGIDGEDFQSSTDLTDLGVDSLMSLAILAKLREAGVDLSPTLFLDNRTMDDVFRTLSRGKDLGAEDVQVIDTTVSQTPSPRSEAATTSYAQCILLQKASLSSARQSLFLLPDGSGSPSAYAALERLDPTLDVYGLACPFIKAPATFKDYGLKKTAAVYIKTILAKCPPGAIHLGGWSVGGVLAFEAAKQLMEVHGRQVASLVLIDAPCPLTLPPMNGRLIRFLDSLQLFAPSSERHVRSATHTEKHRMVLDHFDATVESLARYTPASMALAVPTSVIWARDGVVGQKDAISDDILLEDPIARWILQDRGDLGAHGWDVLLPAAVIEIVTTPGNHFSMMVGGNVRALSMSLQAHFKGL
ncbi:polyketide synthase [Lecanicillium sp. MT-2017a]|nr:polyketide synthase [Lecanicillium sp. MT-2017a]